MKLKSDSLGGAVILCSWYVKGRKSIFTLLQYDHKGQCKYRFCDTIYGALIPLCRTMVKEATDDQELITIILCGRISCPLPDWNQLCVFRQKDAFHYPTLTKYHFNSQSIKRKLQRIESQTYLPKKRIRYKYVLLFTGKKQNPKWNLKPYTTKSQFIMILISLRTWPDRIDVRLYVLTWQVHSSLEAFTIPCVRG